jgi:hypothetical protein
MLVWFVFFLNLMRVAWACSFYLRSLVMFNSISLISSFDLEDLVFDLWSDVTTLEGKMIEEIDEFDKVINAGFLAEIRVIKKQIIAIKEEIRNRVRV